MTPSPSAGRRANGLPAAEWGALVDLDPRLSEALLDRLADAGVAGYVEPAGGTSDPASRAVLLPKRPMDRLWVDASRAEDARAVVVAEVADLTALLAEDTPGATAHGFVQAVPRTAAARVLAPPDLPGPELRRAPGVPSEPGCSPDAIGPDPASPDLASPDPAGRPGPDATGPVAAELTGSARDDELFRQIIASYDRDHESETPPWPEAEGVLGSPAGDQPAAEDPARGRSLRRRSQPAESQPSDSQPSDTQPAEQVESVALPAWLEPEALEDDGHYEPPPPPPVPRFQSRTVGSILAIIGGLLLTFAPNVFGLYDSPALGFVGVVCFVSGAGSLVWSMRDTSGEDPDHGAIV